MRIKKLQINGIRSYLDQKITFEDGVTVIAGPNGSGKSSMLESIFIALYGSKAIVDPNQKIVDLINNDSDNAKVTLTFNHLGSEYEIFNGYRVNSRTINASNYGSVLKKDDIPIAQQFGNTYEAINDILKMDENAFRNCVYIRQGEIDILINASPQERQRMIDDLLQIGKLEEYANRSKSALTSINRLVNNVKSLLDDKKSNLTTLNENDIWQQMNELLTREQAIQNKIEGTSQKKDAANQKIIELDSKIKEFGSITEDIKNLVIKNLELTDLKKEHSGEITQINESIKGKYQKINEKNTEITNLKRNVGIEVIESNIDKAVHDLETKTNEVSNNVTHIKGNISTKETSMDSIKNSLKRNKGTKETINSKTSALNEQIKEDTKAITDREKEIEQNQNNIQKILDSYKTSTIDEFQAVVSNLNVDIQNKLELKTQFEKEVNTIEASIHSNNTQIDNTEKSIRKENNDKISYEANLTTVNGNIESSNKSIAELSEQYLSAINEIKAYILKIGRDISKEITKDYLKEIQDDLIKKQLDLYALETSYRSNIELINKQIVNDSELCRQGICPTCRQKVDTPCIQHDIDERVSKRKEYEAKLKEIKNNLREIEQYIIEVGNAYNVCDKLYGIKSDIKTSTYILDTYNSQRQSVEESIRRIDTNITSLKEDKNNLIEASRTLNEQLQQKKAGACKQNEEYQLLKNVLESARNLLTNITKMDASINLQKAEIEGFKKNINNARKNITDFEKELGNLDKEVEEFKSQLNKVESEIKMLNTSLIDANELYDQTKVIYESSKVILQRLREIADLSKEIKLDNTKIDAHNDNIKSCETQILENNERILRLKQKLGEIDIESLKDRKGKLEQVLDKLKNDLNFETAENNEVQKSIGIVQEKLNTIKQLKDEATLLEKKFKYLNSIAKDIGVLKDTYTLVRSELRSKNINTLNKYINEMFSLMSIDSAYSHIILDNDYNLIIYQKDGKQLDPKQLSGGERAILNIVFRCAIYRLLAVGFGSESSQGLPPIIFDEPTVFLDANHVKQLIQLLDAMKIIGVGQIIVVSHDETLIDAADQVYRVKKDSSTNISKIYETSERDYKKEIVYSVFNE